MAVNTDSESPLPTTLAGLLSRKVGGAFGAGLVLIFLPSLALVFGIGLLAREQVLGLPILAIFGIMILLGALALISTLFARLGLASISDALALPPGSIRAVIALSLIVLFALISVMLVQSLGRPFKLEGLSEAAKAELVRDPSNRVTAVIPVACDQAGSARPQAAASPASDSAARSRAPASACEAGPFSYTVYLGQEPGGEATELAKQLLVLIGTLMTSVTSFYFAARSGEVATKNAIGGLAAAGAAPAVAATGAAQAATGPAQADAKIDDSDGCDVEIANPTADQDLPAARGGVAT